MKILLVSLHRFSIHSLLCNNMCFSSHSKFAVYYVHWMHCQLMSSDFTICEFRPWCCLKSKVYATPLWNIEDLTRYPPGRLSPHNFPKGQLPNIVGWLNVKFLNYRYKLDKSTIFGTELPYGLTFDFRRGATQTGFGIRVRGAWRGWPPPMVQKCGFYAHYVSCMLEIMQTDIYLWCDETE